MKSNAIPTMLILAACGLTAVAAGDGADAVPDAGLATGQARLGGSLRRPRPSVPGTSPAERFARWTGRWNVEFSNGVHQVHELRKDHTAAVRNVARNWSSHGRIELQGNRLIITYVDDRVERWTPVGGRMVVEHWFRASRLPITPPVLGIGERANRIAAERKRVETDRVGPGTGFGNTLRKRIEGTLWEGPNGWIHFQKDRKAVDSDGSKRIWTISGVNSLILQNLRTGNVEVWEFDKNLRSARKHHFQHQKQQDTTLKRRDRAAEVPRHRPSPPGPGPMPAPSRSKTDGVRVR